jgi:hypothetical protein
MSFRISPKVKLEKGDKIRVSSGPYYVSSSGVKINLGEKGIGKFIEASEDGTAIYVSFSGDTAIKYVYIGPEKVSPLTGTILRPHKISKIRG